MVPQTTIPTTVPFVPTIHQQSLVDKELLLEGNLTPDHTWHPIQISHQKPITITGGERAVTRGNLTLDHTWHPIQISHQNRSLVTTSTTTLAATQIINSPTAVSTVEPTMQSKTVPNTVGLSTLAKPQPWTPIRGGVYFTERNTSAGSDKLFFTDYIRIVLIHAFIHPC